MCVCVCVCTDTYRTERGTENRCEVSAGRTHYPKKEWDFRFRDLNLSLLWGLRPRLCFLAVQGGSRNRMGFGGILKGGMPRSRREQTGTWTVLSSAAFFLTLFMSLSHGRNVAVWYPDTPSTPCSLDPLSPSPLPTVSTARHPLRSRRKGTRDG